jgi:hypothetical protein
MLFLVPLIRTIAPLCSKCKATFHVFRVTACILFSLLLLYEGVRDLFAAVDGRDDDEEGAACDYETEFAVADVAVLI